MHEHRARATAWASDDVLDEVEAAARIGSYELDIPSGRWVSTKGLDAIFGIDAAFARTVEGWASLLHPADREAMLAYFDEEVLGRGDPFDREYRIVRHVDGEERWVHGRGTLEHDAAGRPVRMFGTIADTTDRRRAQEALIRSELRYATIFEGTAEAILIAEAATQRFRWVNSAASALLGYGRDELLALGVQDIHGPEVRPMVLQWFEALASGRNVVARAVPCRRKDGSVVWADIKGSAAMLDGTPCYIGFLTDVTELHRLEALDRKLGQAIEQTSEAILITDPTARIEYVNTAFERLSGQDHDTLVGGYPSLIGTPLSPSVFEAMWRAISTGESWSGDLIHRRPDGEERTVVASISPVHAADDTVVGYVAVERDVTEERALAAERERLASVVEQTSDSVIITDLTGAIEYVNPAFEQVSGYRRAEVVGQNPRILKSGHQSVAFYRALWRRLSRGQSWTGSLTNRRRDGSLFEEEATISPVHGPDGVATGYVAVKRDVTALRAAESALAREFRERAEVAASMARLQPGLSAEETATEVCDGLLGLPGIDAAGVLAFHGADRAVPLAVGGPEGLPMAPGRSLPAARARYLYVRAQQGPWAEAWHPRRVDGRYGHAMAAIGMRAVAYAPIRVRDVLLGLVVAGTRDAEYARHLIDQMPAVSEYAATAGALLGRQLEGDDRDERARERVQGALTEGGLRTVFQPIIELYTGEAVGYEALTRFTDGTPPDRLIAEAHSVGLGADLEVACLITALGAAETLPPDAWLSLNLSPDVILRTNELAGLLAARTRQIVIEVTEHAEVRDYPAVRRAIEGFGPRVRLAVDDAGAGFASLGHVVELRPSFLKLDIGLVHHVHRDVTRQAMIAGLRHFAERVGCMVIAEGIEQRAELRMLRQLGIPLGQGHLFGPLDGEQASCPGSTPRRREASRAPRSA